MKEDDALQLIKDKLSQIINLSSFILISICKSNKKNAYLAHFAAPGNTREIEFLTEINPDSGAIKYYKYGEKDIEEIVDLKRFINHEYADAQ